MMDELSLEKDKEIQNLTAKLHSLQASSDEYERKEIELNAALESIKLLQEKLINSEDLLRQSKESQAAEISKLQSERELLNDKLNHVSCLI